MKGPARWILLGALLLAVPVAALVARRGPPLPELWTVPEFNLMDQDGKAFTREDVLGRVWVVDFIFTRCAKACPSLTARMRSAQSRLAEKGLLDRVALLSVTVDPKHDGPADLKAYAEKWAGEDGQWTFVTGDREAVETAVVEGFRVSMGEVPVEAGDTGSGEGGAFELLHGTKLLLMDHTGTIRGFYEADEAGTDALVRDAVRLVDDLGSGA